MGAAEGINTQNHRELIALLARDVPPAVGQGVPRHIVVFGALHREVAAGLRGGAADVFAFAAFALVTWGGAATAGASTTAVSSRGAAASGRSPCRGVACGRTSVSRQRANWDPTSITQQDVADELARDGRCRVLRRGRCLALGRSTARAVSILPASLPLSGWLRRWRRRVSNAARLERRLRRAWRRLAMLRRSLLRRRSGRCRASTTDARRTGRACR